MKKDFKSSSRFGLSPADQLNRFGLTTGIMAVLLVLSAFPFPFLGLGEIRPAFMLMAVYYWAVFRPQMLPPAGAFAAGFALDLVCAYPLGLNALLFVVVQWIVKSQRKFLLGQNFMVIWASFALVAFIAGILQWMVFSLFEFHFMSIKPVLIGSLMTAVVFPLIVMPLFRINKRLERRSGGFK